MKHVRLIAALLLISVLGSFLPTAHAAPAAVYQWDLPTSYDDNTTPLPPAKIAGYNITSCRFRPADGSADQACAGLSKTKFAGGTAITDTLTATIPTTGGQLCLRISTVDTNGAVAVVPSNEGCKPFAAINPLPPTNLRVVSIGIELRTADGTPVSIAYLVTPAGKLSSAVAGFVKVASPCIGEPVENYRGQEYRRFLLEHPTRHISNVTWWKTQPTQEAAAPCA